MYDRARPTYPPEAVEALVARGGWGDVLEVGAGTGKLTRLLGPLAQRVVAVEPDEDMAAVARRNLAAFPHAEVVTSAFELFEPRERFGLVVVAQAWHWLDEATRLDRATRALRAGGWLALLWNSPRTDDEALQADIDAAHERHAPELVAQSRGAAPVFRAQRAAEAELAGCAHLSAPERLAFEWTARYTTDEHAALLETLSSYRMLGEPQRAALIRDISAAIDARGGVFDQAYDCLLITAQSRAPQGGPSSEG